jgi:hypothetical protein
MITDTNSRNGIRNHKFSNLEINVSPTNQQLPHQESLLRPSGSSSQSKLA